MSQLRSFRIDNDNMEFIQSNAPLQKISMNKFLNNVLRDYTVKHPDLIPKNSPVVPKKPLVIMKDIKPLKTKDFFIQKAHEYLTSIEEFKNPNGQWKTLGFFCGDGIPTPFEELTFKIELLFSEFENGEIFIDRVRQADFIIIKKYVNYIEIYKRTLEAFIDHLNEFR